MKHFGIISVVALLLVCACHNGANKTQSQRKPPITQEMAYNGVSNYCHSEYDWSVAENNPSLMNVRMGEGTDSEYHVIFRSYTGALVHFYVDKTSGATRLVETVPALNITQEAGTINLLDYLEK